MYLLRTFGDGKRCPCTFCKKPLTAKTLTVDRIVPGYQGGTYRHHNCQPSCEKCNIERYVKDEYGHTIGIKAAAPF